MGKVDTKNIALEGTLWNGLLGFNMEYFHQVRKDILAQRNASVPGYTGLTLPNENLGKVKNQGFELSLSHLKHVGKDFNYNVGFNMTYTKIRLFILMKLLMFQNGKNERDIQ